MNRLVAALIIAAIGCVPAVTPLTGVPAPGRSLPSLGLAPGHRHIVFRWEYEEGDIAARGDGSVRTAAPDSARLDFFLGGGLGAGSAILIGDTLRAANEEFVRRYLPPRPLMWAVLGRLAIPALPDTVVRIDGDLLRADVGRPPQWRLATRGDTLIALEHIAKGKITERLTRGASGTLTYEAPGARRRLRITIIRDNPGSFDASIWRL